jgi:hypothetical protein
MKTLKGKLEFFDFFNMKLYYNKKEINLLNHLDEFFTNLNDKKTSMTYNMNSLTIKADESSEYKLEYKKDNESVFCLINKTEGVGWSNVEAYLENIFQRLNSRQVIIKIDKNEFFIQPDLNEKVFGLFYTNINSCKIEDDKVKEICKPGSEECCIFLSAGGNGFNCEKFDTYMARMLLHRLKQGIMNAKRIGNCAILGRKENNE